MYNVRVQGAYGESAFEELDEIFYILQPNSIFKMYFDLINVNIKSLNRFTNWKIIVIEALDNVDRVIRPINTGT